MTENDERAQDLENQLDEMEEHAERLKEDVSDAREDWESKKADSSVPGAVGDPKPDEDDADLDPRDPANEDL